MCSLTLLFDYVIKICRTSLLRVSINVVVWLSCRLYCKSFHVKILLSLIKQCSNEMMFFMKEYIKCMLSLSFSVSLLCSDIGWVTLPTGEQRIVPNNKRKVRGIPLPPVGRWGELWKMPKPSKFFWNPVSVDSWAHF